MKIKFSKNFKRLCGGDCFLSGWIWNKVSHIYWVQCEYWTHYLGQPVFSVNVLWRTGFSMQYLLQLQSNVFDLFKACDNKGSRNKNNGLFLVARPLRGRGVVRTWPLRKNTIPLIGWFLNTPLILSFYRILELKFLSLTLSKFNIIVFLTSLFELKMLYIDCIE